MTTQSHTHIFSHYKRTPEECSVYQISYIYHTLLDYPQKAKENKVTLKILEER